MGAIYVSIHIPKSLFSLMIMRWHRAIHNHGNN